MRISTHNWSPVLTVLRLTMYAYHVKLASELTTRLERDDKNCGRQMFTSYVVMLATVHINMCVPEKREDLKRGSLFFLSPLTQLAGD